MRKELIEMFGKVIAADNNRLSFAEVNKEAIKAGYIVHPAACCKDALQFVKSKRFNPNSTFYKTWEDITSKSRFELFVDQAIHYFTTYGTGFAAGNGYVPNADVDVIPYHTYKVILPATRNEIFERCYDMLKSGVALSTETINILIDFIDKNGFLKNVNVNDIKCKEAQCIISIKKGIVPNDEFGMLRVLVYAATNSAMIIKSKEFLSALKENAFRAEFLFNCLSNEQEKKLSRIFKRYKTVFLALKTSKTAKVINKLRKLSDIYHTPLKVGFWETILNPENKEYVFSVIEEKLKEVNNFKKIQVLQGIKNRVNGSITEGKVFKIRNGKIYIREGYKAPVDELYLIKLYKIIEKSVVESLKLKATTYHMPTIVSFAAPTSEKKFIGNFPEGTSISLGERDNVFGIYWKNGWGVRDYDLHYTSDKGASFGWCYDYHKEGEIIYSGDMTNAEPEAAELFWVTDKVPDGRINVNIFSRSEANVKPMLKFFVASGNKEEKERIFKNTSRYRHNNKNVPMIDPNYINFTARIEFDFDCSQKTIGYICDKKIYLMDAGSGEQRVSTTKGNEIVQEQLKIGCQSYVDLRDLFNKAGFVETEDNPEINLTNPSKDMILGLFA